MDFSLLNMLAKIPTTMKNIIPTNPHMFKPQRVASNEIIVFY